MFGLGTYLGRGLRRFWRRDDGSFVVESVIALPLLFLAAMVIYEFFEVHRFNSARDKASYTVADMLSREMGTVNSTYIDNTKSLFDSIVDDNAGSQLRITEIHYDSDTDRYAVYWSQLRGTGPMVALSTSDIATSHATLPLMSDGEHILLIESVSQYNRMFAAGFSEDMEIKTRVITSPRFVPKIDWAS